MRRFTRYFFEGLLFMVPVIGTIYIIYWIFSRVDRLYKFPFPGMGIAITLAVITVVGFVVSTFLTKKAMKIIDMLFTRLPLTKMIYTSIRDLTGAFVGDKKGFNKPVLVQIGAGQDFCVMGFMTNEDMSHMGMEDMVSIYLPQSYNFAGQLIIVKRSQIRPLDLDSGDVMAFVVSGGISGPKNIET